MKPVILILISLLLLSSCRHQSTVLMSEIGYVIEKQYNPDTQDVIVGNTISTNGSISTDVYHVGNPEKYLIIFKCNHGTVFTVNNQHVYGNVKAGDTVSISYYEILNSKNEVVDYDFIDAKTINHQSAILK